jgi:hypothetical protein
MAAIDYLIDIGKQAVYSSIRALFLRIYLREVLARIESRMDTIENRLSTIETTLHGQ